VRFIEDQALPEPASNPVFLGWSGGHLRTFEGENRALLARAIGSRHRLMPGMKRVRANRRYTGIRSLSKVNRVPGR